VLPHARNRFGRTGSVILPALAQSRRHRPRRTPSPTTKYGVEDVVDELYTYLDTSGDQRTSQLPEWEDFQELAEEYEMTL